MALLVTCSLEHILIQVPESEGPQTIGQWGPVVGLVTTLFVIFLIRRRVPTPNPHNSQYMRPRQGEDDLFSYRPSQLSQPGQPDQRWYWKNRIIVASIKEWRDLKDWWRDPIMVSREHRHEEFTPENPPPAVVPREPPVQTV
ncbi:hypothetical protein NUW58_g880 [Xylaria curta]|uniref:Uncharacterized protein n=2 Tax=Xylaria curta TaxID=42375 RepID=A0ACC1PQI5_9PEZI|nr:hypothetical protein NUW58_g2766 [Xylaria curta]KAJ2996745.1 hypothetical protein NUW58_g880 [Xylaria curta]